MIEHLDNPVTSIATINQPNFFYEVATLVSRYVLMIVVSLLLHSHKGGNPYENLSNQLSCIRNACSCSLSILLLVDTIDSPMDLWVW